MVEKLENLVTEDQNYMCLNPLVYQLLYKDSKTGWASGFGQWILLHSAWVTGTFHSQQMHQTRVSV